MKKLKILVLILLCFLPLTIYGQKYYARIIGTATGFAVIHGVDTTCYDFPYSNRTDLASIINDFIGTGGTSKFDYLTGIVNVTVGFPVTGDSTLTHSDFIGKHITVIKNGQVKQQHLDNTGTDGFWFDNGSGTITFKPALQANEQLDIWATNTIVWTPLAPQGAVSSLLTGLQGWYNLDETLGTAVADATGTQNGVTTATVGVGGKFGLGENFTAPTQVIQVPHNISQITGGTGLTLACWVYITTLPTVSGNDVVLMRAACADDPYTSTYIGLSHWDNSVRFVVYNSDATPGYFTVTSSVTLSAGQWYQITAECVGSGSALKLYINGTDVSSTPDTFTGTILANTTDWYFGNMYPDALGNVYGYMDAIGIWPTRGLSGSEITKLQTKVYPFN